MIRARIRALCVLLVGMTASPAALADVLIDQPVDHVSFFDSFQWGNEGVQAGDDLVVAQGKAAHIKRVTFWMVVTWPNVPFDYSLEVYRTIEADYWPWGWTPLYMPPDHRITGPTEVIDQGEWTGGGWHWNENQELHLVEVVFDSLDLVLSGRGTVDGRWFFSPEGLVADQPFDWAYWPTSGNGALNWSEAWFKTTPFGWPGWRPISSISWWDPTDFAMRIEGEVIPAPSALPALGVLFGVLQRGRRRMEGGGHALGDGAHA